MVTQRTCLSLTRRGKVIVGMKGFLLEIGIHLRHFAGDERTQIVAGDTDDSPFGFNELHGFAALVELALVEEGFSRVGGEVLRARAPVNGLSIWEKPPLSSIRVKAIHLILPPAFHCSKTWELSSST